MTNFGLMTDLSHKIVLWNWPLQVHKAHICLIKYVIFIQIILYIWYNWYNISTAGCFNLSGNQTFFDLNDASVIDCQNWCYNASAFAVSVKHMLIFSEFLYMYKNLQKKSYPTPFYDRFYLLKHNILCPCFLSAALWLQKFLSSFQ